MAWAAGATNANWWPGRRSYYFWPRNVRCDGTVEALVEMFESRGYEICSDASLEDGYEKIAIYADGRGYPTHAARQLETGAWTSKLGGLEDIEHDTVDDVNGPDYGAPVCFMRQRTKTSAA
ncbi:DUF7689 domain-containing protein [Candidatus Palauibacter sp.]|uniref:DUF7689 domain-containing protein n=1 Tax=Candidatus Palauibacter sp. TaxID=3101350 RepID=UPI003B01E60A